MNNLLFAAALATIGFMFLQDIFGSSLVVAEARELKFWPGLFDGLGDLVSRYGVVIAAVAAVHFGLWSWQTAVLAGLTAITSFFTSNLAVGKASKLLPKSRLEQLARKAERDAGHVTASVTLDGKEFGRVLLRHADLLADLLPNHQPTTEGAAPMSLLDTIAAKFHAVPKLIAGEVAEAEKLAHSSIAEKAEAFVKEVLPLIPDGGPAEEFVKRIQEGVSWAHQALAEGQGELAKVDTAAAPVEAAVAAAAAAVETPVETAPPAAVPDATDPAQSGAVADANSDAGLDAAVAAAQAAVPVDVPAPAEAAPVTAAPVAEAAPVNTGNLFTTTLDPSTVNGTAWPVSPFKTADGQVLYTWAGEGPAPAGAEPTWVAYTGAVVPA